VAKGRNRVKVDRRGPLQRVLDNAVTEEEQSYLDVITPEMSARGDYGAENKGRRYFRLRHLDRLHRAGRLTYEQHAAGDWYRTQWEAGRYDSSRTADWTRVRGENVVQFTLPTKAQQARDNWRSARSIIPVHLVGFADRFLLQDNWPKVHHRAMAHNLTDLRKVLDSLARHLRLT
jgi:hypothetical protein